MILRSLIFLSILVNSLESFMIPIQYRPDSIRIISRMSNIDKIHDYKKTNSTNKIPSSQPIEQISFDKICINLKTVIDVYITPENDMVLFHLNNKKKYLYIITNKEEHKMINKMLCFLPKSVKIMISSNRKMFSNNF